MEGGRERHKMRGSHLGREGGRECNSGGYGLENVASPHPQGHNAQFGGGGMRLGRLYRIWEGI